MTARGAPHAQIEQKKPGIGVLGEILRRARRSVRHQLPASHDEEVPRRESDATADFSPAFREATDLVNADKAQGRNRVAPEKVSASTN